MTTNFAKYFCILLVITQIPQLINAAYVKKVAINNDKNPTNQLSTQKQQQQQKQGLLLQHKHIKSVDERLLSDVSVSDVKPQNYQSKQSQKSYDKIDDVVNEVYADINDELDDENVNDYKKEVNVNTLSRQRRDIDLSAWLIAPNTRWCGRGNTAKGRYNNLGGASLADKCCRRHDHCKKYISAMSTRYELFNYRPYTLSHCSCDRRFRTCLKMANDEDANTIGKLFFNVVQTQCFILHTETICQKRAVNGTCEQESFQKKAILKYNKKY